MFEEETLFYFKFQFCFLFWTQPSSRSASPGFKFFAFCQQNTSHPTHNGPSSPGPSHILLSPPLLQTPPKKCLRQQALLLQKIPPKECRKKKPSRKKKRRRNQRVLPPEYSDKEKQEKEQQVADVKDDGDKKVRCAKRNWRACVMKMPCL